MNRSEVERIYTRGSGNGGQNRNKRETVVVLTHKPTGIVVRSETQRTQGKNEEIAWALLEEKLKNRHLDSEIENHNQSRSVQIGTGVRSDKRRTYRDKDDLVIDHITNKSARLKDILKGKIELLY